MRTKRMMIVGGTAVTLIAAALWVSWDHHNLDSHIANGPGLAATQKSDPAAPHLVAVPRAESDTSPVSKSPAAKSGSGTSADAALAQATASGSAPSSQSTSAISAVRRAITHVVKQEYSAPVQQSGEAVVAAAEVGDTRYEGSPNQMGEFPRVDVNAKAVVPVTVSYAQGKPGQVVTAQVIDGGALKAGQAAQLVALNDQGEARFAFTAGDQPGIYRVRLSKGADFKMLNFWVPTN